MDLKPKNWSEFQHYKNRKPPWIKLHRSLLDDSVYHRLPDASKALAPCLWLLASESDGGVFKGTVNEIAFRVRQSEKWVKDALKPLIDNGFFLQVGIVEQSASSALASRTQSACLETEKERETERLARATRLPADWVLPDDWKEFASTTRPDLNVSMVADDFRDYWTAKPGSGGTKLDWLATWRKWVRNANAPRINGAKPHASTELTEMFRRGQR